MHVHPLWNDEYWPLVIQLYFTRPAGVKAMYSKGVVHLGMELHIPPAYIHERLQEVDNPLLPSVQRLKALYQGNTRRLNRDAKTLRQMAGFGSAGAFYEGVMTDTRFERFFRPVADDTCFTPAMLTLVLNLYFQLVPDTMTALTPEVTHLARHLHVTPQQVVTALHAFLAADPCVPRRRNALPLPPSLAQAAKTLWQHYDNGNPDKVTEAAGKYGAYFSL